MAEPYNNPPPAGSHHPPPAHGEDNEPRIDGDGQEVNALRFLGAGGPNPPPPAPSITPVSSGVSQPIPPQNPPAPPQTPHQHQHQHSSSAQSIPPTPGGVSSYDPYSDPGAGGFHHGMQVPPGPASGPYAGMMAGGPMMMMPSYPYGMYPNPYGFMAAPPAYPPMPAPQPTPNSQTQLVHMLNVLRVQNPKVYREWYKKYQVHKRNPDRVPFPPMPPVAGFPPMGPGSSQTLPSYGRSRKESTRSSINGDASFSRGMHPNDSFADYPVPNTSRNSRRPNSGRASVNGEDFDPDGAPSGDISNTSLIGHVGSNSILSSTLNPQYSSDRDRPPTQSGRSSRIGESYRLPPGDVYGDGDQHDSLSRFESSSLYGFSSISQMEHQPQVREPSPIRRTTPMKFSTFHCIATMSPLGHMIRIKNSGTVLEFIKMKQFVGHLPEYKEMESFPGPLTQLSTHKNTVIQYCKRKIKEARSNPAQLDRENYILLWEFLMLMLRQNGMVVGSDIAELLLTAVEQQKQQQLQQRQLEAQNKEDVRDFVEGSDGGETSSAPLTDKEEGEGESSGGEESVPTTTQQSSSYNPPPPVPSLPSKDENKLVEEFCQHLLYGHKKDALDFAMDHGLWGHALFFASKMDERSYGHVLARFANGIPLSSPLQTLYHIMCGKQPASVTSCGEGDESGATFGDWKPHLAMLLSNSGYKPEVEHRAILTLGDTLQQRNHVFAAQFCYLMGHEEFRKDSRLGTLLGYSPLRKNVLEATQMTEVYEFARKLADPNFNLGVSFQQSKLEYAKTLVSYGLVEEALAYCEEITKVLRQSGKYGEQEREELIKLSGNTLKIAERIAVADESGTANSTWVQELRGLAQEPGNYFGSEVEDSFRKMSLASSSNPDQRDQQQQQFDQLSYSSSGGTTNQQGLQQQSSVNSQMGDGASSAGASLGGIYDPYGHQQQLQSGDGGNNMMGGGGQYTENSSGLGMITTPMMDGAPPQQSEMGLDGMNQQQQQHQQPQMTQDNSWGQSAGQQSQMMNGGLHLSQPQSNMYEPPQIPMMGPGGASGPVGYTQGDNSGYQQQQQGMDGGYQSAPSGYGDKTNQPTINNNHWYHPYDNQPQLGGAPDYSKNTPSNQNSSPVKKKSVRFEDQRPSHNQQQQHPQRHGLVGEGKASSSSGSGNGDEVQSVVRSRIPHGAAGLKDPADLKSALKNSSVVGDSSSSSKQQRQKTVTVVQNGVDSGDLERCSKNEDRSGMEVEYKSTYPIDEPIEAIRAPAQQLKQMEARLLGGSSSGRGAGSPSVVVNHPYPMEFHRQQLHHHQQQLISSTNALKKQQQQHIRPVKTFPVDKKCCDANRPCEDHNEFMDELEEDFLEEEEEDDQDEDEEGGGSNNLGGGNDDIDGVENGNYGPSLFTRNQNKTDPKPLGPSPATSGDKKGSPAGDKKKSKKDSQSLDGRGQQDGGWFSGLSKILSFKAKNQMILPDDKNPTIVWDDKQKRWVNTAGDGDDDLGPAPPPPKDSELIGGPKGPPPGMPPPGMPPPGMPMQNGPQQPPHNMMMPPQPQQQQQQPQHQQQPVPPQGMMMIGQPQQQQQQQQPVFNNGMHQQTHQPQQQQQLNPSQGMGNINNNNNNNNNSATNKYKLQKSRGMKGYVDVFNPNSGSGGGGGGGGGSGAPSPPLPVPTMQPNGPGGGAAVPNLFIPPPMPQGGAGGADGSGPVSFLTPAPLPSDDNVPGGQQGQDNSLGQAAPPPMFNPAQFQGYSQGQ